MVDNLLIRRTALPEGRGVVGSSQVPPEGLEVDRDVEVLESFGGHSDVLQFGEHEAIQVIGDVPAEEPVGRALQVRVEATQFGNEGLRRMRNILDVKGELGEDVATGVGSNHVVVVHGWVAEVRIDVLDDLVGLAQVLTLVLQHWQSGREFLEVQGRFCHVDGGDDERHVLVVLGLRQENHEEPLTKRTSSVRFSILSCLYEQLHLTLDLVR